MTKVDALTNQHEPKARYKITNRSEYNASLKQRGSLTDRFVAVEICLKFFG
jgi:hypothetical protein